MYTDYFNLRLKMNWSNALGKRLSLTFSEMQVNWQEEDLDCSSLPITGETVCNYDEGFLAGILKVYTKKEYVVTEVDCWATGSRVCRFEASVKNLGEFSIE